MHLRFCCRIYREQIKGGRYFVHEHPQTAASWAVPCMRKMVEMPEVHVVNAHMCAFGMKSKDERGEGFAKKPTKFLTNSGEMARALNRQCPGDHRHVHLMAGRARAAAIYPKELCVTVCKATMRQATVDAGNLACMKCVDKGDGDVMNVEFEEERWEKYWDDLTGK